MKIPLVNPEENFFDKSDDGDWGFTRLFSKRNFDHLPLHEQANKYKTTDLSKSKAFKAAARFFGGQQARVRLFKVKGGGLNSEVFLDSTEYTSGAGVQKVDISWRENNEEFETSLMKHRRWLNNRMQLRKDIDSLGLNEFWFMNKPNKNELEKQIYKQIMEKKYPKPPTPKMPTPPPLEPVLPETPPKICRPSPMALRIFDRFLQENRLRLVDLFSDIDKNKDLMMSVDEFKRIIQRAKIPISDVLLEDLILTLDTNLTNQIDFGQFSRAMQAWRRDRREMRRKALAADSSGETTPLIVSPQKFSEIDREFSAVSSGGYREFLKKVTDSSGYFNGCTIADSDSRPHDGPQPDSAAPDLTKSASKLTSLTQRNKELSSVKQSAPEDHNVSVVVTSATNLSPPESDLRPEQLILSSEEAMVELRKHDREALARALGKRLLEERESLAALLSHEPSTDKSGRTKRLEKLKKLEKKREEESGRKRAVLTGDQAIDDHSVPSVLDADKAEKLDGFRLSKLREYFYMVDLCRSNGMVLNEETLKRALLHPGDRLLDKIKSEIKVSHREHVRKRNAELALADEQRRQRIAQRREWFLAQKHATNLADLSYAERMGYTKRARHLNRPERVDLPTGRLWLTPRVDSWVTMERYNEMTRDFETLRSLEPIWDRVNRTVDEHRRDHLKNINEKDYDGYDLGESQKWLVKHASKENVDLDNDKEFQAALTAGVAPQPDSLARMVPRPTDQDVPPVGDRDDAERETWSKKVDFLLSVIGFAVDLSNVWRFPHLCFKNGGGAFLIPYVLMLVLGGIPLFYLELCLGQFHRKGAITTWGRICPLFKGIGISVVMIAFYVDFYYNIIISWALYFFFASFTANLPWTMCNMTWNTPDCVPPSILNSSEVVAVVETNSTKVGPAEEYFNRGMLESHKAHGVEDLGSIKWQLVLCMLGVYLICYFSLWKGISTSGKVVWFTALFPYCVLFILLIRGVTLPGAKTGMLYYITPKWSKLIESSVWIDAATQVFFSLGPGFGVLLAFASYNKFNNNVYKDALVTSCINCATSFLAGFVIFSILGYMAKKSGRNIEDLSVDGPGLVFQVYPEAIALLPGSTFWSLMFFLMLLTLGLDSSFGGSEAIITAISDEVPILKRHRELFVAGLFSIYALVGLASCTQGGSYVVHLFDNYAAGHSILVAVFFESIAVSWFYGIDRVSNDICEMLSFRPGIYWRLCWKYIAPIFVLFIVVFGLMMWEPLTHKEYVYPSWANTIGWLMALSSMLAIPLGAIYQLLKTPGSFKERLRISITPYEYPPRPHLVLNNQVQTAYSRC